MGGGSRKTDEKSQGRIPCINIIGEVSLYLLREYLIGRENCVVVKDMNFKFAFEQFDFPEVFFVCVCVCRKWKQ